MSEPQDVLARTGLDGRYMSLLNHCEYEDRQGKYSGTVGSTGDAMSFAPRISNYQAGLQR